MTTTGQCLCGDQQIRLEGELSFMHHCHCGFCRKHHGSAFATIIGVDPGDFHWERGGPVITYNAGGGYAREACGRCGSVVAGLGEGMPAFVPTGILEDGFDQKPEFEIFAASKLPWVVTEPGIGSFEAFPPGIDAPSFETRAPQDPPGGTRGSCLCGEVRFVLEGDPITARNCHCSRCRRGRAAAYASNLMVPESGIRFTNGRDALAEFKVPEAEFFTQAFCRQCGSCAPRVDSSRGFAVVPISSLDDPTPLAPVEHIFVDSKATWCEIADDLPRHADRGPR